MDKEYNNRFLVDVLSDAHQVAINHNLSYKEGILYNNIAYTEERWGECYLNRCEEFLHMGDLSYEVSQLYKKGLINVDGAKLSIRKYSLEELAEDEDIAVLMKLWIEQTKVQVGFDPLKCLKK